MPLDMFAAKKSIKVRALLLGERLDLRALESTQRLALSPLTVNVGDAACAVMFRYGAVVLFNLDPISEMGFLTNIKPLVHDANAQAEIEETTIYFDPTAVESVGAAGITLHEASIERLQIVADILGKSVFLGHYESGVGKVFDRIEPLAIDLQQSGNGWVKSKELLRHIGGTLLIHHKLVGRVEVAEKPDLLWEHPEVERLFLRLEDEYEIKERHAALERKLELILRTVETLQDLLHVNRSLRLEWYVIILIGLEIVISLVQIAFGRH